MECKVHGVELEPRKTMSGNFLFCHECFAEKAADAARGFKRQNELERISKMIEEQIP